jgi:hypothetical protein
MRKLFHGISRMWGVAATNGVYSCGLEMAQVEGFSDAWMAVDGGRIVALGVMAMQRFARGFLG